MNVTKEETKNIKKVVVLGPECTGKTDLSKYLAEYFKTACVEEYARAYLNKLVKSYDKSDLTKIAHGQVRMEDEWIFDANQLLICDTNLQVIKIWSEFNYGDCDPEILKLMSQRTYDLFLLTYIDIPWEADPQREHPDKREELWAAYKRDLDNQKVPYVEIRGEKEQRRKTAVDAVQKLLSA